MGWGGDDDDDDDDDDDGDECKEIDRPMDGPIDGSSVIVVFNFFYDLSSPACMVDCRFDGPSVVRKKSTHSNAQHRGTYN